MEYERDVVVRTVGALPVVVRLCERLGLVEGVDRLCPIRDVAEYTHGQVVLALVCNRLTHPRPLSSFTDWGERFAVQETLGIAPVKLNDDRLGRTLDVLADHLDEVLNLVGRRAIERFGISLGELHWDLTDLRFTGGYGDQDERFPQVKKGRTPERTIVRQVKAGHWVTADGALPVTGRSFDGNQGDPNAVEPALAQLDALRQGLAEQQPAPLVVRDSKLRSQANVLAFQRRGLRFCCPHPKDAPLQRRLAALEEADFQPLSYRPQRQKARPAALPRLRAEDRARRPDAARALRPLALRPRGGARPAGATVDAPAGGDPPPQRRRPSLHQDRRRARKQGESEDRAAWAERARPPHDRRAKRQTPGADRARRGRDRRGRPARRPRLPGQQRPPAHRRRAVCRPQAPAPDREPLPRLERPARRPPRLPPLKPSHRRPRRHHQPRP